MQWWGIFVAGDRSASLPPSRIQRDRESIFQSKIVETIFFWVKGGEMRESGEAPSSSILSEKCPQRHKLKYKPKGGHYLLNCRAKERTALAHRHTFFPCDKSFGGVFSFIYFAAVKEKHLDLSER